MLKISKKISYGLQAVLYLARKKEFVSAKKISKEEKIPLSFLEQIMRDLRQSGLVKSKRGSRGGYQLSKSPQKLALGDVVRSLENDILLIDCLSSSNSCPNYDRCLAKNSWNKMQQVMVEAMDSIYLQDLITNHQNQQSKIYLDYAATTPLDPLVLKKMTPYFSKHFGNPASIHWAGKKTDLAVSEARQYLAQTINAGPEEIIFTNSATESNNTVIKGLLNKDNHRKKIIISAIEHDCVLNSAKWAAAKGYTVEIAPVDNQGRIRLEEIERLIDNQTLLVSVIHASNEIGSIQDIRQIGKFCQNKKALFHVDAAQSYTKLPIDVNKDNIDFLTVSSHKIYGPKGIAFLYKRKKIKIEPLLHGGGQEQNYRSSTLNVPAIVGFAEAAKIAFNQRSQESKRIKKLRDWLETELLSKIPNSYLNGHPTHRLYNILNIRFDFIEGEALVLRLSLQGIAASTGSACSSPKLEPSHVLTAIGLNHVQAHGSLRLSLGRCTSKKDVETVAKILPKIVANLRDISPYKS